METCFRGRGAAVPLTLSSTELVRTVSPQPANSNRPTGLKWQQVAIAGIRSKVIHHHDRHVLQRKNRTVDFIRKRFILSAGCPGRCKETA